MTFPLLADAAKKLSEAYGVLGKNGLSTRSTFVIDKKGVLRKTFTQVSPATHPNEVLKFVEENLK